MHTVHMEIEFLYLFSKIPIIDGASPTGRAA